MDSDSLFLNFEQTQREIVYELNMKRRMLKECRQELTQSNEKCIDLETVLDKEKREHNEIKVQFEIATNALRRLEDERTKKTDCLSLQKIQLEIAENDQKKLLEQYHNTKVENTKLNTKLEELQEQQQCNIASQKDIFEKFKEVNSTVVELKSILEKLETDQKHIQKDVESAIDIGTKMDTTVKKLSNENTILITQCDYLEKDFLAMAAKYEKCKQDNEFNSKNGDTKYCNLIEKLEDTIKELRTKLSDESRISLELIDALGMANESLLSLQEKQNESMKTCVEKATQTENEIFVEQNLHSQSGEHFIKPDNKSKET